MPPKEMLTTAEIAKRWRCNRDKVLAFIHAGRLRAINVSLGSKRARFLVDPDDLATCEQANEVVPILQPKPRRRRSVGPVTEYF